MSNQTMLEKSREVAPSVSTKFTTGLGKLPVPTWNSLGINQPAPSLVQRAAQARKVAATSLETLPTGRVQRLEPQGAQKDLAADVNISIPPNATSTLIQVALVDEPGSLITSEVKACVNAGASFKLIRIILGASGVLAGSNIKLAGEGASYDVTTFYIGNDGDVLDFNDVSIATAPRTSTIMETTGILQRVADKIYRGTIDFRRGSSGSTGSTTENVLMLADGARNRTAPLILCAEEDVVGDHGATIGRLDAQQLYYMQSRGMTQEAARRLLMNTQLELVLSKLDDTELAKEIRLFVSRHNASKSDYISEGVN